MVFKMCAYDKGTKCTKRKCLSPDKHPYYIKGVVVVGGVRVPYRTSVRKVLHLLPVGEPEPRNASDAARLDALVVAHLAHGGTLTPTPPPAPPYDTRKHLRDATLAIGRGDDAEAMRAEHDAVDDHQVEPEPSGATPRTVLDAINRYDTEYAREHNARDNGIVSILNRFRRELAINPTTHRPRPVLDLFEHSVVTAFLDRVRTHDTKGNRRAVPAVTTRDQHCKYLRGVCSWLKGTFGHVSPELDAARLPFFDRQRNRFGVKKLNPGGNDRERPPVGTLAKLHAAAARLDDGGMMTARLWCAELTGLRQGKMLALRPGDIIERADGHLALVARKVTHSKYRKTFEIDIFDRAFAKWLRARRASGVDFIFGQLDGTRIEAMSFRTIQQALWEAAGLDAWQYVRTTSATGKRQSTCKRVVDSNIHWHDLRHECGSVLGDAGLGQKQIQTVLGQSSTKTSERYTNPDRLVLREGMRDAFALARAREKRRTA